jgi:hypothetical protein
MISLKWFSTRELGTRFVPAVNRWRIFHMGRRGDLGDEEDDVIEVTLKSELGDDLITEVYDDKVGIHVLMNDEAVVFAKQGFE